MHFYNQAHSRLLCKLVYKKNYNKFTYGVIYIMHIIDGYVKLKIVCYKVIQLHNKFMNNEY